MSNYYESDVIFMDEAEPSRKRRKYEKINGGYCYIIRIIDEKTLESVYETTSTGKNQKDAVLNFRKNEPDIRSKYLELGGYMIGISKL